MRLGREFIKGDDDFFEENDKCELCDIHEQAIEALKDDPILRCPYCKHEIDVEDLGWRLTNISKEDVVVVGESNTGSVKELKSEYFKKALLLECEECKKNKPFEARHFTIALEPFLYNANHDVYYTGGRHYLPVREEGDELRKRIAKRIKFLVKNYTDRIKSGKEPNLNEEFFTIWIQGQVEEAVADFLYEKRYGERRKEVGDGVLEWTNRQNQVHLTTVSSYEDVERILSFWGELTKEWFEDTKYNLRGWHYSAEGKVVATLFQ